MQRDKNSFPALRGFGLKTDPHELRMMIETLEANGYIVRKPSEADLESVLEVERPVDRFNYEMDIRLDTTFNGVPYALMRRFPFELVLDPDNAEFRENALPRIFANEIAHYLADKLMPGIATQVEAKIKPLVPERRMGRDEIVSHFAAALRATKHRIEPRRYDKDDNRLAPRD